MAPQVYGRPFPLSVQCGTILRSSVEVVRGLLLCPCLFTLPCPRRHRFRGLRLILFYFVYVWVYTGMHACLCVQRCTHVFEWCAHACRGQRVVSSAMPQKPCSLGQGSSSGILLAPPPQPQECECFPPHPSFSKSGRWTRGPHACAPSTLQTEQRLLSGI